MLNHVVHMQIPLLPVYCNLNIHPASFLSQMLPSAADKYIHASFVREVMLCQYNPLQSIGAYNNGAVY